jgi:hypothetical protein
VLPFALFGTTCDFEDLLFCEVTLCAQGLVAPLSLSDLKIDLLESCPNLDPEPFQSLVWFW